MTQRRRCVTCGRQTVLLTPRELLVLTLAWEGHAVKPTAAIIGLSDRTVRVHRLAIYRKFGVHNIESAIRKGVEDGLLIPSRIRDVQHKTEH